MYATTARGVDRVLFANNILDLAMYGRQELWEDSPAGWPQSRALPGGRDYLLIRLGGCTARSSGRRTSQTRRRSR
jgi:hypothetical protein